MCPNGKKLALSQTIHRLGLINQIPRIELPATGVRIFFIGTPRRGAEGHYHGAQDTEQLLMSSLENLMRIQEVAFVQD